MTYTNYLYSIITSTANGLINPVKLSSEIRASNITIALDGVSVEGDDITIVFKDVLPDISPIGDQELILNNVVAIHDGAVSADPLSSISGAPIVALDKVQKDGAPLIAIQGRVGSEAIYATHNFTDKTTWYTDSHRHGNVTLTQSGSIWHATSSTGNWIDLNHGKVFDEEGIIEDQKIFAAEAGTEQHGYEVKVFVSGVQQVERTAFATTGGDFVVDYSLGTITPTNSSSWVGEEVTADFCDEGSSVWILKPTPGKVLVMEKAEVQFSEDVVYADSLDMEVHGLAAYFAPQFIQANGGPLPNDTKVPLDKTSYKTIDQIIDEAINAYPQIPPIGNGPRGFAKARNVFQFHYGAVRKLYSSLGLEVHIYLGNNIQFGGERATATFYCTSLDDKGAMTSLKELGLV